MTTSQLKFLQWVSDWVSAVQNTHRYSEISYWSKLDSDTLIQVNNTVYGTPWGITGKNLIAAISNSINENEITGIKSGTHVYDADDIRRILNSILKEKQVAVQLKKFEKIYNAAVIHPFEY